MRSIVRLLAAVALGLPAVSQAGTADYVLVPNVEYGEREIDLKYGTERLSEGGGRNVDIGFVVEVEVPREHRAEGYEIMMWPLFQSETGALQWNANLLFERVVRGHADPDEPRVTEMGYQLQMKYRARPELEFGLQAFCEMGDWKHWEPAAEQKHLAGPALFGKVKAGGHESIHWNAAWPFGLGKAAPDERLRVQVEYEF